MVIKVGGDTLNSPGLAAEMVADLWHRGERVVLVHGGGPQLDEAAAEAGIYSERVAGRRITSPALRDLAVAVWRGTVSMAWVQALAKHDVPALGLSGLDGGWLRASRRPPVAVVDDDGSEREVDFGLVGDIDTVEPALLHRVGRLAVPVIAPLAMGSDGEALNVNADTVAAVVAVAMGVQELCLITGAPGILADPDAPDSLILQLDQAGLDALEAAGALRGGMRPKVAAVRHALHGGVPRVCIGATEILGPVA